MIFSKARDMKVHWSLLFSRTTVILNTDIASMLKIDGENSTRENNRVPGRARRRLHLSTK